MKDMKHVLVQVVVVEVLELLVALCVCVCVFKLTHWTPRRFPVKCAYGGLSKPCSALSSTIYSSGAGVAAALSDAARGVPAASRPALPSRVDVRASAPGAPRTPMLWVRISPDSPVPLLNCDATGTACRSTDEGSAEWAWRGTGVRNRGPADNDAETWPGVGWV